jgi:hypothetical protein
MMKIFPILRGVDRSLAMTLALLLGFFNNVMAQNPMERRRDAVPAMAEIVYEKGMKFLATSQNAEGAWSDSVGEEAGVVGLCVAAFLAHGEDPVEGRYAVNIRRGIEFIIKQQDSTNGYIGSSMYNHAFATKALAEAYGQVDIPAIEPALRQAVDLILSAQKRNRSGGWRYTPESRDADTTVTGCQLVTLFAARNAGVAVPELAIRKGLAYLESNRAANGSYGYTSITGGKPTLTVTGTIPIILSTTCPRHCFMPMRSSGENGTSATSDTFRSFRHRMDPFPAIRECLSTRLVRCFHWR